MKEQTVSPADILPPMSEIIELPLPDGSPFQIMTANCPRILAQQISKASPRWVWVEGFSGSGKSTFAAQLAHHLEWQHIELDNLLHGHPIDSSWYADHMDYKKLGEFLGRKSRRSKIVVDGICLRDVLSRLHDLGDAFVVYIARVSQPTKTKLIWHDGIDMTEPNSEMGWLTLTSIRYHGEFHPYANADRLLLRIAN